MINKDRSANWSTNGKRSGFLYNVVPTTIESAGNGHTTSISIDSADTKIFSNGRISTWDRNNDNVSKTALALYFISEDGFEWHTNIICPPYFYVSVINHECVDIVMQFLHNTLQTNSIRFLAMEYCKKIDLSLPNHLERIDPTTGKSKHSLSHLIKIQFNTIDQLERGRDLIAEIKRQYIKERLLHSNFNAFTNDSDPTILQLGNSDGYLTQYEGSYKNRMFDDPIANADKQSPVAHIGDIYEYDVKYVSRVCIDMCIRCGTWYEVERNGSSVAMVPLDKTIVAPLNIFAWDIECYKSPLKFPDMECDEIILISIMFNGQGYLIVNRSVISEDITEFSYQPSEDMIGTASFMIFNEVTERDLLQRFFNLIQKLRPHIFVTYNGDNFDFPYVYRRAEINDIPMGKYLGIVCSPAGVFANPIVLNMDCYKWVERDSYLPFGSRTLKEVCKLMLKYNPVEIDPEDMVPFARHSPQKLAVYSVSDAVATYYLYVKFIHNFIFALCYIVPLPPNEILRQGTGTLCENLLMAEAYANNILFPNKHSQTAIRYYTNPETEKEHLIYESSYIGGRVESLRCGIFRDDQLESFELNSSSYQMLIDNLEETLLYWGYNNISKKRPDNIDLDTNKINHVDLISDPSVPSERLKKLFSQFENFDEAYREIYTKLCKLRDQPSLETYPRIYHLDVGAMYPNIIISQRLQPTAIVTDEFCRKCAYYDEASLCQKKMRWKQKLEISPVDKSQIRPLLRELKSRTYKSVSIQYPAPNKPEEEDGEEDEDFTELNRSNKGVNKTWEELTEREQGVELQKLVKVYSQKIFKKSKLNKETYVESIICQRENPFYVQTVLNFRDRRYIYKRLKKDGENELKSLLKMDVLDSVKIKQVKDKIMMNDSLQLAYKCILNSFYGYVKRAGSRWYSMEMGAIVTFAGASIIDSARRLIETIGIPIELDTDGIWCMLPDIFPAVIDLKYATDENKSIELEYMTSVLNLMVAKEWTNEQYLELEDTGKYHSMKRNEVLFELDGPWHAMFLPASEKSEELLKKRYVVYNSHNQIVELKGFEIKRRGEMRMIQLLQEDIFPQYLLGRTKSEAYNNAAKVALCYREALETRSLSLTDDDMFDLLIAKKTVKKPVNQQPNMKCFGITSARRLAELFKNETYLNDGNLSMTFLLTSYPLDSPRTARAIPIQIFKVDPALRAQFLSKWLKVQLSTASKLSCRDILDWDYYKEKLDKQILKLICLPAIMQGLSNPIPHMAMPIWIKRRQSASEPKHSQINTFFPTSTNKNVPNFNGVYKHPALNYPSGNVKLKRVTWLREIKMKWVKLINSFTRHTKRIRDQSNYTLYKDLKSRLTLQDESDFDIIYTLFSETWHIYGFSIDDENPGVLNCTVSIYGKPLIYNVKVELWRKFYINNKKQWDITPNENVNVVEIKDRYILPRGAPQINLIELEMKESHFLENIKNSLNSIFHKTVSGVYETQIPITFDFIVRSGNMVNVGSSDICQVLNDKMEFRSNALRSVTTMQSSDLKYMDDVEILFVHIFHGTDIETKKRNKFFGAIYSKGESMVNRIYIGGMTGLQKYTENEFTTILESVIHKHKSKLIEHKSIRHDDYINPESFPECFGETYIPEFDVSDLPTTSCKSSLKKLNKFMSDLKPSISKRKYFVYLYSAIDINELGEWATGGYFPVYYVSSARNSSNQIISNIFIKPCFDESMEVLYKHYRFIEEKLSVSRISSIPFGILLSMDTADTFKCVFDVMYARALRSSYALLWGTRDPGADLGFPQSPNLIQTDYDIAESEIDLNITSPGIYRGYGAKVVFNQSLMFNAIILESKASDLSVMDPKFLFDNIDNAQIDSKSSHLSLFHPLSFKALGSMMENLMKLTNLVFQRVNYGTFQNIVNICSFLKPWLSDTGSILHDPALYRMALLSTKKYLVKLIHYLNSVHKLKTIDVDSSFIILDSNTVSVTLGRSKINEALDALGSNQSKFKNIPFYVEEEYVAMVQLDKNCYIRYKNYTDTTKIYCSEYLKALEYLPCAVEMFIRFFLKTITLDILWHTLKPFYESTYIQEDTGVFQEPPSLITANRLELQKRIEDRIMNDWHKPGMYFNRIYDLLSDSNAFLTTFDKNKTSGSLDFPMMPGSDLPDGKNWRFETIKLLTYIIQIDTALDWKNVSLLSSFDDKRHRLFMLAGESEYASETWRAPMRRFEIKSLICGNCFMVSDIDVISCLRYIDNDEFVTYCWPCQICDHPLDNKQVEAKLIQYMENTFYAYQIQDNVCSKCKSVKTIYGRKFCSCGENYTPRLSESHWTNCFNVANQLSQLANMKTLQECLTTYGDIR